LIDRNRVNQKGLASDAGIDQFAAMRASLGTTVARVLTWCCVGLLAVLSLWPGRGIGFLYVLPELNSMRTGLPGQFEHFIAYAGSARVAVAGYGMSRGSMQIIGGFCVYAAALEYLQHFSTGRHPSLADFAASAVGALCGGLASMLLWRLSFRQAP
jgi:VanZ family protein